MTISTEQYNEAAKHLIEAMQPEPMGTQELADRIKLIFCQHLRKTLLLQPCAFDAINQLVDLVAEAHKLVRGSVEMQDAYTKMQEQASGHTHDVYTMPLEREFIAKADALLTKLGGGMSDLQYDNNGEIVIPNTAVLEIERKANAVREMTVDEAAHILAEPYVQSMKEHYARYDNVYNATDDWEKYLPQAKALAKLGAIRIVDGGVGL